MCDRISDIKTSRLLLRQMEAADAPSLYRYWSDREVTRHMNISPLENVSQAAEMIALLNSLAVYGQAFRWSILSRETRQVLGSCGFNHIDRENRRAEVGYELGKEYWGQGFMLEALGALLQYGYYQMQFNRIQALVEPPNAASRGILGKLGFQEEGLLRQYERSKGQFIDLILYAMLKEDFEAVQAFAAK